MDAIQKVTQALESSGIIADSREEEDTDNMLIKRSVGTLQPQTDVTTEEYLPETTTTPEMFKQSIQPV
jgi:hypothetical protein